MARMPTLRAPVLMEIPLVFLRETPPRPRTCRCVRSIYFDNENEAGGNFSLFHLSGYYSALDRRMWSLRATGTACIANSETSRPALRRRPASLSTSEMERDGEDILHACGRGLHRFGAYDNRVPCDARGARTATRPSGWLEGVPARFGGPLLQRFKARK
jgi:hypothetical protein